MNKKNSIVWIAAVLFAVGSCTSPVQELSSFWKDHNFRSLDAFDDIKAAEDKFDNYINLLNQVSYEEAVKSMNHFLDSAALDTIAYMVWSGWFEPFLHAQQSPYKNDALFAAWLDRVLVDRVIDDEYMMNHLEQMRKVIETNTIGSKLRDVSLRDGSGEELMLAELIKGKTLILLVDANCPSCLSSLEENANKYKRTELVAVLVGGSILHIENIKSQLSESLINNWTFTCASRSSLEASAYDLYNLPTRILVSSNGEIIKSYH